jgi:hypothetical protein
MKKSELKTGMKVVTRNKKEWVIFSNFAHEYDKQTWVMISNDINSWNGFYDLNENLLSDFSSSYDIMKIYIPSHVYCIGNFFGQNNGAGEWKLIYEREEKVEVKEEPKKADSITVNITATITNKDEIEELVSKLKRELSNINVGLTLS